LRRTCPLLTQSGHRCLAAGCEASVASYTVTPVHCVMPSDADRTADYKGFTIRTFKTPDGLRRAIITKADGSKIKAAGENESFDLIPFQLDSTGTKRLKKRRGQSRHDHWHMYAFADGAFGLAILYFVPQDGQLGKNEKRAGQDIFDIYYWMDSWPHFTDLLRNEKPVQFQYDDSNNTAQIRSVRASVPGGSKRFADRFIKAHLLSRQNPTR
jgi:hypothetical protein